MKKLLLTICASGIFLLSVPLNAYSAEPFVNFYTSKRYLQHINRGYIAMSMSNYPLALKEFHTAKYLDDSLSAAYEGLGNVYEYTRNYKEALSAYQSAIGLINPKYAQDQLKKILYYRQNDMTRSALGMYKTVLAIRPEAGLQMMYGDNYLKMGSKQQAYTSYKRAYELQENPQGYLKYIQIKYPNKEYEKFVVQKYIQRNLRFPEAHYKAGIVSMGLGNFTTAVNEFTKAVEQITVPNYENKYIYNLGLAYYKLGTAGNNVSLKPLENSIVHLQKFIKLEGRTESAMFTLADAYFYRDIAKMNTYNKELETAEKEFNKVSKFPVDDPEYIDKKNILEEVLQKKYNPNFFDRSLGILEQIKTGKYNPEVHYSIGNIYFKKANMYHKGFYDHYKLMNSEKSYARDKAFSFYQKAIEEYRKYISLKPNNNGYVYHDIGVAYYDSSKLEPNRLNLPITPETKKDYERYGTKFYTRDMMTRAIKNFEAYLVRQPRAANSRKIRNLISELNLARLNLW